MSEGEQHGHAGGGIVAVANVNSLAVFRQISFAGELLRRKHDGVFYGEIFRKLAARIFKAVTQIDRRGSACLA